MDVLADSGALPQGGSVVDEDAHAEQGTRGSIRYANVSCFKRFRLPG
jgi:hypothetical protein